MAENASISSLLDRVARTAPFRRELAKLGTEEQAVFDHTALPGVPFVAALCINSVPETCRTWVVTPHLRAQESVASQLETWGVHNILFVPEKEVALGEEVGDPELTAERLNVLHRIASGQIGRLTVVLTENSLNDEVPSTRGMKNQGMILKAGETRPPDELEKLFTEAGFEGVPQVISRGQWSRRGGILDVFPLQSANPVRLEFFDDEIESIREFDVDTQVSFRKVEHVNLVLQEAASVETLRDWIRPGDLVITTPFCKERGHVCILAAPPEDAEGEEDFSLAIHDNPLGSFDAGDFVMQEMRRELAERQIREWLDRKWNVSMFFPNQAEEERFKDICAGTPALLSITCLRGDLPGGFSIPEAKTAVLSSSELFGRYQSATARRRASREDKARKARAQASLKDINPGDLVVHTSYGIGKFINISTSPDSGDEEMNILYRDNTILHVPLSQAHLVSRYIGLGSRTPELNKLGDSKWQRAKKSAERSVADYAAQLLNVQAERQTGKGYSHPPDSKWMWEFESSFPFRETPDQLRAIAQTKADMESSRPMDRLICGDVGFGKTEVAIRAAFKCVTGGRQAAVLVPTTVLAEQHFRTFKSRMSEYPVRIEMLSRLNSAAEVKSTLEGLKNGSVDIVIGTHRLISEDVSIKNLGLVVIDEEQRFGVKHKEKFKERFKGIDVLTLSATPIPRTLYIALMGARDMSSIDTPPVNRQPVQTSVCPYDERIMKKAMERELERGGQIFLLHNRVKTIELFRDRIQALVPKARIVIGHGQMPKDELEKVMSSFVRGEADILLATTIIESGIDIPNANTIIIDRADRFGLADLYQLRGRVGRSGHRAYAYLMLPRTSSTTEDARKRVSAIKQYTELGSGFKIAMRDLEIRGAGNLLGTQQSGHIAAIGFDLYCQLLQQSISHMQGKHSAPRADAALRADFIVNSETQFAAKSRKEYLGAFIPRDYISDAPLRIAAYKDLAGARTIKETDALLRTWEDRFGPAPETVHHLLAAHKIKILATMANISMVEVSGQRLMLTRNGDFILLSNKFPRLAGITPAEKLQETLEMLKKI